MSFALRHASRLWGLQTSFENYAQQPQAIGEVTLRRLLAALCGFPVEDDEALARAIHLAHANRVKTVIEPVVIATVGESIRLRTTLPEASDTSAMKIRISPLAAAAVDRVAHDSEIKIAVSFAQSPEMRRIEFENQIFVRRKLQIHPDLESGYYRLELMQNGMALAEATLLCRPPMRSSARATREASSVSQRQPDASRGTESVETAEPNHHRKQWGVFAPVYALKSPNNFGMGDFTDVETLQTFLAGEGCDFFGTLPLLSAVNEGPDADSSPYSPVSKLFYNEIYLDCIELSQDVPEARALIENAEVQSELEILRASPTVDHLRVYALKKPVLQILADHFFQNKKSESVDYLDLLKRKPWLLAYAEFRSKGSKAEFRFHCYCQFELDRKLRKLTSPLANNTKTVGHYLDFPVGVSRSGFDAENFASSFLVQASAGAPPDLLFHGGQNWGFAPLHPVEIRKSGYLYFRECLRANLEHAAVLRIDHIMAFHRLYVIPQGMKPTEGGYLRYRPDEFFAVLAIEGEKSNARVVGEDLGTVPEEIRHQIVNNDCLRMWVYPFEVGENPSVAIAKIPKPTLACLDTHDLIPFAGYLTGRDAEIFAGLGFLEPQEGAAQSAARKKTVAHWKKDLAVETNDLMRVSLQKMAESDAEMLLLNIEDLWRETEPQNTPGTWREMPNWQKKLKLTMKEILENSEIKRTFKDVAQARTMVANKNGIEAQASAKMSDVAAKFVKVQNDQSRKST